MPFLEDWEEVELKKIMNETLDFNEAGKGYAWKKNRRGKTSWTHGPS
jgi:hypothetical protein